MPIQTVSPIATLQLDRDNRRSADCGVMHRITGGNAAL